MTDKNNDGFEPGQDLSFADLMAMRAKGGEESMSAPTREDIDEMDRDGVIALLKAHGVEDAKGKIADLRKRLTSIMFVDL
ncbi:hypothetical protein NBRC116598_21300 [Pseudophaeobacter arcticus]|uniref:Uncharacterized protein n=1 Tax=Pseudophaeobacter arcticus TaxID=385492 RepID=A0ABQ0ALD6_9RHOB